MDFNTNQKEEVQKFYGNRLRVRTCGLVVKDDALLLLKHGLGRGEVWLPPGGGIEVGESATDCLMREMLEETNLIVKSCDFLFAFEFINESIHAIELFFRITEMTGDFKLGSDVENAAPKVLLDGHFLTWKEISQMPKERLHGIFQHIENPIEILNLKGYFTH